MLIALAHIALIAGLIRWSVAAKPSQNPESIIWLGGASDLAADEIKQEDSSSTKQPEAERESNRSEKDEPAKEKPDITTAKSEIELPTATPEPTATATPRPKPSATPAARPKPSPKPIPKTSRKTVVAKASPKPATKPKPKPEKSSAKSEKNDKITLAKNDATPHSGSGSTGKGGTAGGGVNASEFGWYGDMLHDRFYSAWIQPTTNVPSGTKISTLVSVRIEKDGRVSRFEITKPSGNGVVNESVRVVARQVTQVDPPPTGLIKGNHYDIKINFELNTEEKPEK